MKVAGVRKYLEAEQADQERLRSKGKQGPESTPKEPSGSEDGHRAFDAAAKAADNLEAVSDPVRSEPLSAEDGIDLEDTSFLMPDLHEANPPDAHDMEASNDDGMQDHDVTPEAAHEPAYDDDMLVSSCMDMISLMDTLQVLGVDVVAANGFVASVLRENTSIMEVYGRGNIVSMANTKRRDLNILGRHALDLRTRKRNGDPWDFSKEEDRLEAEKLVHEEKPDWVIGSPPCTAFCRLMALNFIHWSDERVAACLQEGRQHLHFMIGIYRIQLEGGRHFFT